ncbi:Uncharacterized protein APZ42_022051 [Daphnia magna]|uniref:Uncharacterized protein n=1 Tax=Daphnia magna TaxID=35525 RepID=A0A164VXV7_9CRUS|nr:Uncharacterized protein APZ42_022051 [Daphnia magna]
MANSYKVVGGELRLTEVLLVVQLTGYVKEMQLLSSSSAILLMNATYGSRVEELKKNTDQMAEEIC